MDGDAGHIKMTRVFRTSIFTQLNTIKTSFLTDLTPNGKFNILRKKKKIKIILMKCIVLSIIYYIQIKDFLFITLYL